MVLICLASSGVFPDKPKARTLPAKNQKQEKDHVTVQPIDFIIFNFCLICGIFKILSFWITIAGNDYVKFSPISKA